MLNIAIPKGSLEDQTLKLFEAADLAVQRNSDREYNATIKDPRIGKVKVIRPQEIPKYVEEGYFDLGISGLDWVKESGADVAEIAELYYSKTKQDKKVKIVLAIPEDVGISDPKKIRPGSRISTEYPNITKAYFKGLGIPVRVDLSYGATEAKVPEIADGVVEITETGSTLRSHGMKIIATIMESSTKLVANKKSLADPAKRREIEEIRMLLAGTLAARGKVLVKFNIAESKLKAVAGTLPAMTSPTISKLVKKGYCSVETVVDKSEINILIPKLKAKGAHDILEFTISKIVP